MGKQVDDVGQQKEGNCCPRSIVMMERNRQNYDSEFWLDLVKEIRVKNNM